MPTCNALIKQNQVRNMPKVKTSARSWNRKGKIIVLLLVFLVSGAWVITTQKSVTQAGAPDITLQLLDGRKLALSELRGQPVMIVFWATSCVSCIKEIPHFSQLYKTYHSKGLEIIAVAMPYDRPDHVLEMQKEKNIPYPIALDLQSKVVKAFGNIRITPNTFVISPQGHIVKQQIGLWDMNELETLLQAML